MAKKEDAEPLIQLSKKLTIALFIVIVLWLLLCPQFVAHAEEPPPPIPETIRVRITGRDLCGTGKFSHVEVMDFKEYVKGVLAAEWGNRWHTNSLRVGAIAVKMYAMSAIEKNGKWPASPWAQDRVADVYDCNWDQVVKHEWRTEKSDKAVDDTWEYLLIYEIPWSGQLFNVPTYHKAWEFGCMIGNFPGQCISQWDSLAHAKEGIDWKNILLSHYDYYEDTMIVTTDLSYTQTNIQSSLDHQKVEGEYTTHLVQPGDTLIKIAYGLYGEGKNYLDIFELNTDVLRDPNLIYIGQYLNLPEVERP